jgi:hypothetical protein
MALGELSEQGRVLRCLEEICSPDRFGQAQQAANLLRYLVRKTIEGVELTRKRIATEHFDFDLSLQENGTALVGVRVSDLRKRLILYYATRGQSDPIVFQLPARGFKVHVTIREPEQSSLDNAIRKPLPPTPGSEPLIEILKRCGVENAFRIKKQNPERLHRVMELIQEECGRNPPHFRLAASSGQSYLHPSGAVWGDAGLGDAVLELGARVEVVLESPFSDFAECRALANEVTKHHWHTKVDLSGLQRLVKDRTQQLSIRVTEIPVNCSLFFTSSSVFYDPYLWARPSAAHQTENNFWVFEFRKTLETGYDCYDILEKHFVFLQQNSIPLSEFLSLRPSFERRGELFEERIRKVIERWKKVHGK